MRASYKKFLQTLKWCHTLQGNSHLKKLSWYGTHWLHLRCNHNKTPVFESLIGWIVIPFLSINPSFAKNLRNVHRYIQMPLRNIHPPILLRYELEGSTFLSGIWLPQKKTYFDNGPGNEWSDLVISLCLVAASNEWSSISIDCPQSGLDPGIFTKWPVGEKRAMQWGIEYFGGVFRPSFSRDVDSNWPA